MTVEIWPRAVKDLKKLPKIDQLAITAIIRKLGITRVVSKNEKLQGFKNVYRIRVGKYRLIYLLVKSGVEIIIIAHRREAYNLLKRLW